ncbi:hypothetical protein MTO96_029001 [Rhipicephalus appendiculatus]
MSETQKVLQDFFKDDEYMLACERIARKQQHQLEQQAVDVIGHWLVKTTKRSRSVPHLNMSVIAEIKAQMEDAERRKAIDIKAIANATTETPIGSSPAPMAAELSDDSAGTTSVAPVTVFGAPVSEGRNQPRRPRRKRRRQPRDFEPRSAKAPATQRPRTTPVAVQRPCPTLPQAEDDFVTVGSTCSRVPPRILARCAPLLLRADPCCPPASSSRTSPPAAPPAEPAEDPRDALITTLLAALRAVGGYLPSDHPMRSVCLQAASAQSGATTVD